MTQVFVRSDYGWVLNDAGTNKFSSALNMREQLGLNSIIFIVGARGIGKSWEALKIAEIRARRIDLEFSADDVVFSMEEFLERLDYYENQSRKWAWLVFDEVGLDIPARDFMQLANKIMSYVAQSFRKTAVNLIVVCPHRSMVDMHVRMLNDFYIVMKTRGYCRVYTVGMNPFASGDHAIRTPFLCELQTGKPSDALTNAYEEKRREHLNKQYATYSEQLKAEKARINPLERREEELAEVDRIAKLYYAEKIDKKEIAKEFKRTLKAPQNKAYDLRDEVMRKVENWKENPE